MTTQEIIYSRLQTAFSPDFLNVTDESDQHIGHAGHRGGGHHFAIEITAHALQSLTKIEAHRQIYAVLNDLIPDPIHAIKIHIK